MVKDTVRRLTGGLMTKRVLFARVGWMRWYRGVQPDDLKPIGGGAYNDRHGEKTDLEWRQAAD